MNKLKIILMAVCVMLLTTVPVHAYSDEEFSELKITHLEGFYTEITDTGGDTHTYDGAV